MLVISLKMKLLLFILSYFVCSIVTAVFMGFRVHNYTDIWEDLRTLSQVWKKVLLPTEDEFSQGISRAIYLAVGSHFSPLVLNLK